MKAGQLRHRVTIQKATVTRGPAGGEVATWTEVAKRWASVEPLTGNELFAAQQAGARAPALIRLRGEGIAVLPSMRVIHERIDGRHVYDITSVANPDGRDEELHLRVVEAVG